MKLLTFAIYDSKADAHSGQWTAINAAIGLRIFQDIVMDERKDFAKHPGDFSLMETGTYDQTTGVSIDNGRHIDHGTGRQARSRYLLEQDYHEKSFEDYKNPPPMRPPTNSLELAESISRQDALRATRKESS